MRRCRKSYEPRLTQELQPLEVLLPEDAACYLQDRVAKEGQHAGDETAARTLAEELGFLPLALEQAAAFIIELRWSFDKYRERLRKLLAFGSRRSSEYLVKYL